MANNLFNLLNPNGMQQPPSNPLGGFQYNPNLSIQDNWSNFKQMFNGDPVAIGQQMVNSGQINQQAFNMLSMMANMYRGQFK